MQASKQASKHTRINELDKEENDTVDMKMINTEIKPESTEARFVGWLVA